MAIDALKQSVRRVLATVGFWIARGRERRVLEDLDDRMLRDVGLSRKDVLSEAGRPIWSDSDRLVRERQASGGGSARDRRFVLRSPAGR